MARLLLILLCLACCGAGPADVIDSAVLDLSRVPQHDRQHIRYLSLWPGENTEERLAVYRFWLNSLTFRRRFVQPVVTEEGLLRLDLKALGWKAEAWEKVARADPYFAVSVIDGKGVINRGWVDPKSYLALSKETHSVLPVLRADWFLARTSLERGGVGFKAGFYSDILGLPATEDELFKQLGAQRKLGTIFLATGGAVQGDESEVALHNRGLEEVPSLLGNKHRYLWVSDDVADESTEDKLVTERFLGTLKRDGGEHVYSLPNGLQGYYLCNADGKQVSEVPANIAQHRNAVGDVTVMVPHSCVTCHDQGIKHFNDLISRLAQERKVALAVISKGKRDEYTVEQLEDYYLTPLGAKMKAQQEAFDEACRECCGLGSKEVSAAFTGEFNRHFYGRVDLETARAETGFGDDLETYIARSGSGTANTLLGGGTISREVWENLVFHRVMKAAVFEWESGDEKVPAVPAGVRKPDSDRPVYRP